MAESPFDVSTPGDGEEQPTATLDHHTRPYKMLPPRAVAIPTAAPLVMRPIRGPASREHRLATSLIAAYRLFTATIDEKLHIAMQ